MNVIDLSHTIRNGMQIFPGDPAPAIGRGLTHDGDYCHVDVLKLGSHTGTHIDAPFHFLPDGRRIDALPVQRFMGHGVLIDATGLEDRAVIGPDALEPYLAAIQKGDFAIFRTGWDRFFGGPRCLRHPFLSAECALRLADAGITLVGTDALNVDPTYSADESGADGPSPDAYGYPVHEVLLGREILIVENLCRLDKVSQVRGLYAFLPLKLKDGDGSPIRAVHFSI